MTADPQKMLVQGVEYLPPGEVPSGIPLIGVQRPRNSSFRNILRRSFETLPRSFPEISLEKVSSPISPGKYVPSGNSLGKVLKWIPPGSVLSWIPAGSVPSDISPGRVSSRILSGLFSGIPL